MARRRRTRFPVAFGLVAALGACAAGPTKRPAAEQAQLGLFTSLPIYWGEAADITAMLNSDEPPHWARAALEQQYTLAPMDVLDAESLQDLDDLILAQPRPLAPSENVALDDWVRAGGRALVFADPMLAQHSIFPIGDKRRPQDVVLLSPILARWGLVLRYDEAQAAGIRIIEDGDLALPVTRAGTFAATGQGEDSTCDLSAESTIARCTIGEGSALIVADADLLDPHAEPASAAAFDELVTRAFSVR